MRLLSLVLGAAFFATPLQAAEKPWPRTVRFAPVAGGHKSIWERDFPCRNGHFFAEIKFKKLTPTPQWSAVALIYFSAKAEKGHIENGNIGVANPAPNVITAVTATALHQTDRALLLDYSGARQFPVDKPIRVDMSWQESRKIFSSIGGVALPSITTKGPLEKFGFSVSGAEATFDNIVLECGLTS